jgi:hypothetical protein
MDGETLMGNVIRKYRARGGEAGKGTIFKKKGKPYAEMTREEKYKWMRLGIEPKDSPTDTKKITKVIKKKTTNGKKLVDERFIAAVEKRPPPVKDTRFVGRSDKVSPKKDVASTDKKIGVVTKKKDYINPKIKDQRKYTPYKTTKKFVPVHAKEEKKIEVKTDDKTETKSVDTTKTALKEKVDTTTAKKIPYVLKESKDRLKKRSKTTDTDAKANGDTRIPEAPTDNISTNEKDYSKEVLTTLGTVIVGGLAVNRYSKRIQRIIKAIRKSPTKFKNLLKKIKKTFKADTKTLKKLDLTKGYGGAKKTPKKKIKKRRLGGPKPKPEIIKDPHMLVSKGGGQIVSRKGSGAIGVGKALRGWGAVRKR